MSKTLICNRCKTEKLIGEMFVQYVASGEGLCRDCNNATRPRIAVYLACIDGLHIPEEEGAILSRAMKHQASGRTVYMWTQAEWEDMSNDDKDTIHVFLDYVVENYDIGTIQYVNLIKDDSFELKGNYLLGVKVEVSL